MSLWNNHCCNLYLPFYPFKKLSLIQLDNKYLINIVFLSTFCTPFYNKGNWTVQQKPNYYYVLI